MTASDAVGLMMDILLLLSYCKSGQVVDRIALSASVKLCRWLNRLIEPIKADGIKQFACPMCHMVTHHLSPFFPLRFISAHVVHGPKLIKARRSSNDDLECQREKKQSHYISIIIAIEAHRHYPTNLITF